MQDKAAIIAIGSELLAGQITNRNAAWLSARLLDIGIEVTTHLVIDDCESKVVDAVRLLIGKVTYLFVTGGLGPTSDDVTRQAIAASADRTLVFDSKSWQHIQDIFRRLQLSVPESNRQQCYFPQGSEILVNRVGTANAFMLAVEGTQLIVLPGPPREVEAVWLDHVHKRLSDRIPEEERIVVRKWRTIGRGESAVAELVEPIVSKQGVIVSYRAHAPYVETKIRYQGSKASQHSSLVAQIDQTLQPWLFESDNDDVVSDFCQQLRMFPSINLYDGVTQGSLLELLAPKLRDSDGLSSNLSVATSWENHDTPALFVRNCLTINDDVELALAIAGFDDQQGWAVGVRRRAAIKIITKESPYRGTALRSRNLVAIASLAVREFLHLMAQDDMH